MDTTTPARPDLDEIEARVNAATEGPWVQRGPLPHEVLCKRNGNLVAGTMRQYDDEGMATTPDAAFIAHARTDIPALLAYCRELVAERDAAFQRGYDSRQQEIVRALNEAGGRIVLVSGAQEAGMVTLRNERAEAAEARASALVEKVRRLRQDLEKGVDALHACLVDLGQIAGARDMVTGDSLSQTDMQRVAENASAAASPVLDAIWPSVEWLAGQALSAPSTPGETPQCTCPVVAEDDAGTLKHGQWDCPVCGPQMRAWAPPSTPAEAGETLAGELARALEGWWIQHDPFDARLLVAGLVKPTSYELTEAGADMLNAHLAAGLLATPAEGERA